MRKRNIQKCRIEDVAGWLELVEEDNKICKGRLLFFKRFYVKFICESRDWKLTESWKLKAESDFFLENWKSKAKGRTKLKSL